MSDGTYQPLVYRRQGGNELVVASGGKVTVESGGEVELAAGTLNIANGTVDADALAADAVTTDKIEDGAVTAAKLADGAGVAALLTAGLGASANVDHDDAGSPLTIVAANGNGEGARAVLAVAICTETMAGTTPPTFKLGEEADDDSLFSTADLAGATEGDVFVSAGLLTEEKALIATWTAGANGGEAPAGAYAFTVLVLPTA